MKTAMFAISAILSLQCSTGMARPVPLLSYDELLKKADVVVIVRPGSTRDAVQNDPTIELEREHAKQYLTACVTPMKVLATIKGVIDGQEFLLPHYRMDWPKANRNGIEGIGNGPLLVTFADQNPKDNESDYVPSNRDYIIFLVKRQNGGYDFVTGQFDPKFSVFRLNPSSNGG